MLLNSHLQPARFRHPCVEGFDRDCSEGRRGLLIDCLVGTLVWPSIGIKSEGRCCPIRVPPPRGQGFVVSLHGRRSSIPPAFIQPGGRTIAAQPSAAASLLQLQQVIVLDGQLSHTAVCRRRCVACAVKRGEHEMSPQFPDSAALDLGQV
jgi:hypothetical protein